MATYTLKGTRFIRRYDAPVRTPVYSAASDAAQIAADICNCPWVEIGTAASVFPSHNDKALDANLETRDLFDAANFCTNHKDGMHLAHANVACYKFALPSSAVGLSLTSLTARISCDPYCRDGARVAVNTNSTGIIPTACEDCRTGLAHAERVAPRTVSADGSTWYGATADAVITPSSPIQLGSYLYVIITLETPSYSRDAWLEGAAKALNSFEVTLSAAITGIADGSSIDCSRESREYNVCRGGVLPELPAGSIPVRHVTLQTTGDPLPTSETASAAEAPSGVWMCDGVSVEELIPGLPVGSVLNVCHYCGSAFASAFGDVYDYTCICGSFGGGSIRGISGLYIYDNARHELVTVDRDCSSSDLATFASSHGGIAAAYVVPLQLYAATIENGSGSLTDILGIFAVASDGYYIVSSSSAWGTNFLSMILPVRITIENNVTVSKEYPNHTGVSFTLTAPGTTGYWNVRDLLSSHTTTNVQATSTYEAHIRYGWTWKLSGYDSDTVVVGRQGGTGAVKTFSHSGTVIAMCMSATGFYLFGGSITLGSSTYSGCVHVKESDGSITTPGFAAGLLPDTWNDFSASVVQSRTGGTAIAVSGRFSRIGTTPCNGYAVIDISSGAISTNAPYLGNVREQSIIGRFVARSDGNLIAAYANGTPVVTVPDDSHAHTGTTSEQSCIGLRTAFARFYTGRMVSAAPSGIVRPGAAFCVTIGTQQVATTGGDRTVPTCQIAASALVVPCACPTDYAASRIRLDWSDIDATIGSTIRVWLKRGDYLDKYPDISSPDLWQSDAADGWEHVGTIDAATDATSATFDISPLRCRVATLLITAYVSMDDVNPDDDTDSPQGVGTLAVNPITGAVTGSGFIPDITIIG